MNWRTNLYYLETEDFGKTWHSVDGKALNLPLTQPANEALVYDYKSLNLNVYLKDMCYDENDRPIILFLTSKGYASGPKNNPRTWRVAKWNGKLWQINQIATSDNNYDMGSLWLEKNTWQIIAPTGTGPQPYNPGGEVELWRSGDSGNSWKKIKQLTSGSVKNHNYVRRPVNAHPEFYAFWADGHGRKPSESTLYFCDIEGNVYLLPREMKNDFEKPEILNNK